MDLKQHLKDLCAVAAPSGHEAPVRDVIRAAWADWVDDIRVDGLGSLIAVKRGSGDEPRRQIMLCAHMDEIGMIVSDICSGFIATQPLGGIDYRVLMTQNVIVHGRRALPGVIGAAPPHMGRPKKEYPQAADLWIDVGLPADEVAGLVRRGDVITFDSPPFDLKGERVAGKSMDNRASVAVVSLCLHELQGRRHAWDMVAVASAQEESGASGASTAAYQIRPDLAIAIDGSYGRQRGVDDDESFALGDGPTIGRGPNFHARLADALHKTAREHDVRVQSEVIPGSSGTDAWEIQLSREGIPTALIGLPMLNMHSPIEVVDLRDLRRAARLLVAFIAGMDADFMDEISFALPGDADR